MSVPADAVAGAVFFLMIRRPPWSALFPYAALLRSLVSSAGLEAATVAVLAIGPVAAGLMCTTIVKSWGALGASVPKLQVTVPAAGAEPPLAETKLTRARSHSVTVAAREAGGRSLLT